MAATAAQSGVMEGNVRGREVISFLAGECMNVEKKQNESRKRMNETAWSLDGLDVLASI